MVLGIIGAGLGIGAMAGGGGRLTASLMRSGLAKGYGLSSSKFPRATKYARDGLLIGGATYGMSQASGAINRMTTEHYISKYGDTEENRLAAQRRGQAFSALATGAPILGYGAAKLVGASAKGLVAGGRAAGRHLTTWKPTGRKSSTRRSIKMPSPRSFKGAFIYGGASGAAFGGYMASQNNRGGFAPEGTITGMQSSAGGGMSPSLQFSTQGLTLGIHSNRKRRIV